jgi:prepilin peptidase CpaA
VIDILLVLLFVALLLATWHDVRTREVPDTLSWGLIVVGVLGTLIYALLTSDLWFFLEHLIGFGIGAAVGFLMYYLRQWGGGDAKLLMGVGAIYGFSWTNLQLPAYLLLLVLCGALYGFAVMIYLAIKFRKKFFPAFKSYLRTPTVHKLRITMVAIGVLFVVLMFFVPARTKFLLLALLTGIYLFMYSWIFLRVAEKELMVKEYPVGKLTEGDWIIQDVKVKGKLIVSKKTPGVTNEQIAKIRKSSIKKVLVKEGIPFVPGFLIAFLVLLLLNYFFGGAWLFALLG